jgi:NAD(P)H-nitrite reductase large subunit
LEIVRERELHSVSAVFEAFGTEPRTGRSKPAMVSLLKMVWGSEYDDERDARFINDRVHANIQRDGTFSVVPQIAGGVATSDQLRRLADVADRYEIPIQHYRENARWLERTYAFVERVGVDEVLAVVVEDRDGDGERLDAALERSLAAYRDPWLEGREPVVARQFKSVVREA